MNAALAPFSRAEFEQFRGLMERMVDHLQQLAPRSNRREPESARRDARAARGNGAVAGSRRS